MKVKIICLKCGSIFERDEQIHKTSVKNNWKEFCSKACAASFNTKGRKHAEETKQKISRTLSKFTNCKTCGKEISYYKKYCNKDCKNHGKVTLEELKKWVFDFYNENSFSPTSKLSDDMFNAANRFFKSWNKMLKAFNLPTNPKKFGKKILICKDGHKVDSISELLIDNWFFENNILHERNKRYPNTNMTCDFFLPKKNLWVEYFGLHKELKEYDATKENKEKICGELGLNLISIIPESIYPNDGQFDLSYLENLFG